MMRVAIVQDTISISGRSRTIAEMVRALVSQGWTVTVLSLSSPEDVDEFRREYRLSDIDFVYVRVGRFPGLRGQMYKAILCNAQAARWARSADLVVYSTNSLLFTPAGGRTLHYVHFPIRAELQYNARFRAPLYKLYSAPAKLLTAFELWQPGASALIANSGFTRQCITDTWKASPAHIEVVYPPAYEQSSLDFDREPADLGHAFDVVSVGGIIPDKRQLEQVQIAQMVPEANFGIIGRIWSRGYFAACESYIREYKVSNVKLLTDVRGVELKVILHKAKVFLHTRRYEHFGIATVEAIAAGTVPLVHNSGGQREVVPLPELRFSSVEDAAHKLRWLLRLNETERKELVSQLQEHAIRNFAVDVFHRRFMNQVNRLSEL